MREFSLRARRFSPAQAAKYLSRRGYPLTEEQIKLLLETEQLRGDRFFDDEPSIPQSSLDSLLAAHGKLTRRRYTFRLGVVAAVATTLLVGLGYFNDVVEFYERLTQRNLSAFELAMREGCDYVADYEWQSAQRRFETAQTLDVNAAEPYGGLAMVAWANNNSVGALQLLEEAAERDPINPSSRILRLKYVILNGEYESAEALANAFSEQNAEFDYWVTCLRDHGIFTNQPFMTDTGLEEICPTIQFVCGG